MNDIIKTMTTTVFLLFTYSLLGSTTPTKHFVWAPSGMNVRSAPTTDAQIIARLAFGDSVTIVSTTDVKYNVKGITKVDSTQRYYSRYERVGPLILYGAWIEIYTSSGTAGYVIDQYILPLKPAEGFPIQLESIYTDTVTTKEDGYTARYLVKKYEKGISSSLTINEKYYGEYFMFPDMTIQEVFVLLSIPKRSLSEYVVTQNWKNRLTFNDGELCTFSIEQKKGHVVLSCECSC